MRGSIKNYAKELLPPLAAIFSLQTEFFNIVCFVFGEEEGGRKMNNSFTTRKDLSLGTILLSVPRTFVSECRLKWRFESLANTVDTLNWVQLRKNSSENICELLGMRDLQQNYLNDTEMDYGLHMFNICLVFIFKQTFQKDKKLKEFFQIISTSKDRTGKTFISTMEGN